MGSNDNVKYKSITKTFQHFSNSCLLACIESYYADLNVSITQKQMIDKLLPNNLCDEMGLVLKVNIIKAGIQLGLNLKKVDLHLPLDEKYDNSLFLGVDYFSVAPPKVKREIENKSHMIRYNRHIDDKEIIIMDPADWFGLKICNIVDLENVCKEFWHVSII